MHDSYIERVVDLLDPSLNQIYNMSAEDARAAVHAGDPDLVRGIDGSFALLARDGKTVRMARSMDRPMRYFLAKRAEGPALIVADRISAIFDQLQREGLSAQFHPSYTRMVPAHYLLELQLIGCPDPDPTYTRFFTPQRNVLSKDLDEIGRRYIGALADEISKWLRAIPPTEPIGVAFSGGIDSGAVFVVTYHVMRQLGMSPSRLKAFTLDLGQGPDLTQARKFLECLGLALFLEPVEADLNSLNVMDTLKIIEDYKPLDVECATMGLTLCRGIRERYPDWKVLFDGDGGDENLKDYPIEENPELTIRSVLNNLMLYQEGWGVHAIKHSLTYSGGQSRGHVRSYAPTRACGFTGFSPYALPNVIEVAEGIPFIELTDWQHERLYALKGEIVRRGVQAVTGLTMPTFEKRRFQRGVVDAAAFVQLFPEHPADYRRRYERIFAG